jgi:hypothetical protein
MLDLPEEVKIKEITHNLTQTIPFQLEEGSHRTSQPSGNLNPHLRQAGFLSRLLEIPLSVAVV